MPSADKNETSPQDKACIKSNQNQILNAIKQVLTNKSMLDLNKIFFKKHQMNLQTNDDDLISIFNEY